MLNESIAGVLVYEKIKRKFELERVDLVPKELASEENLNPCMEGSLCENQCYCMEGSLECSNIFAFRTLTRVS